MKRTAYAVSIVALAAALAFGDDPLKGGSLSEHLSGPALEPGSLEGKVVLLEYWGPN